MTLWTVAHQTPLAVGFPGQDYWSGLPFPFPRKELPAPRKLPFSFSKLSCHFLLQGIFPTQGWNPHLLHWQVDSLPLSHQGSQDHIANWKTDLRFDPRLPGCKTTHLSTTLQFLLPPIFREIKIKFPLVLLCLGEGAHRATVSHLPNLSWMP